MGGDGRNPKSRFRINLLTVAESHVTRAAVRSALATSRAHIIGGIAWTMFGQLWDTFWMTRHPALAPEHREAVAPRAPPNLHTPFVQHTRRPNQICEAHVENARARKVRRPKSVQIMSETNAPPKHIIKWQTQFLQSKQKRNLCTHNRGRAPIREGPQ